MHGRLPGGGGGPGGRIPGPWCQQWGRQGCPGLVRCGSCRLDVDGELGGLFEGAGGLGRGPADVGVDTVGGDGVLAGGVLVEVGTDEVVDSVFELGDWHGEVVSAEGEGEGVLGDSVGGT